LPAIADPGGQACMTASAASCSRSCGMWLITTHRSPSMPSSPRAPSTRAARVDLDVRGAEQQLDDWGHVRQHGRPPFTWLMTGVGRCDYVDRLRDRLQDDDIAHAFLVLSCRYICERHLTPSQILASTSRTDAANHLPPRAVGIPRSLSALAMARSEAAPLACSSAITGARCPAARAAAASALASAPFWRAFAVSFAPARKPPAYGLGVCGGERSLGAIRDNAVLVPRPRSHCC
jgi:hypothetical protein